MARVPLRVAHALRRRVRVIAPALRRRPERAYVLEILLRKHPAIHEVRVVPALGSVAVRFDARRLSRGAILSLLERLVDAVSARGAAPAAPARAAGDGAGTARQYAVALGGMSCASCALLVELSLRRDPQVDDVRVSYATRSAIVRARLSREEVFARISRLGYTPRPMDTLALRRAAVERDRAQLRDAWRRFTSAARYALPLALVAMAHRRAALLRVAQLALATPVVLGSGRPILEKAWSLARRREANMDTLVALGAGAAYAFSVPALLRGDRHLYFDAAAGIVTSVLLGRYLEERARGRACDALRALVELQPQVATRVRGGVDEVVPVEQLEVGDVVRVRPGERIPTDAAVLEGRCEVDEALLTGESRPVTKGPGDAAVGGCVCVAGAFTARVTAVGEATALAGIVRLVDEAQTARLPVQRTADRLAAVFVPAVVALAGATAAGWLLAGRSLATALARGTAVLLIACPCAVALATPTAIVVGTGRAARRGIFVRRGESLESMAGLTAVVLDKTGTVTAGHPVVTDVVRLSRRPEGELLALIAAAEQGSEHQLAAALAAFARARGAVPLAATAFAAVPGAGIRATVRGEEVLVGSLAWVEAQGIDCAAARAAAEAFAGEGKTPIVVAARGAVEAVLGAADAARPTAADAVGRLRELGLRVLMATGDVEAVARRIADEVGVPEVVARATPDLKLALVRALRRRGERVGMVGDGVNDAPALAAADVGLAVGSGTQVSIEAAAVTLVDGDLGKVAEAIALSRATLKVIRQNLFWAIAYNAVGIPAAMAGRLSPVIASAAMAASSLCVVGNSLRLRAREAPAAPAPG